MLKKIIKFFQKVVISAFVLYSYNLLAAPLNLIIPINIITILLLAIVGIPALLALMIILIVVY